MSQQFTRGAKITVANVSATANTTTLAGSVIDMQGYDAVTFMRHYFTVGTATDGNGIRVQGATASGGSYEDLDGASAYNNAASQNLIVEIHRPVKRFLKALSKRGTASKVGTLYAIRTLPRDLAVTNSATGAGGTKVTRTQSPTT